MRNLRKFIAFLGFLVAIWASDPTYTRLFLTPTAYTLGQGEAHFSVYQIIFPSVTLGISDFFDLAGGISLIPDFRDQVFYIAPKFGLFRQGKFAFATGALYINSLTGEGGAGAIYGVSTIGNRDSSFTIGIAWPFLGGDETVKDMVLLVGGNLLLSRRIKFLTENFFSNSGFSLNLFGLRFFTNKLSVDFGLIYLKDSEEEGFPFFPWLGFSYKFHF